MELWEEMVKELLVCGKIQLVISGEIKEVMESKCYKALSQIRDIVRNDALSDQECVGHIEAIVCVLEEIGSSGGTRHDFG